MASIQTDRADECQPASRGSPPGVYRPKMMRHLETVSSHESPPPPAPLQAASAAAAMEHGASPQGNTADSSTADARRRFHQLRYLRREMSGRPSALADEHSRMPAPSASPVLVDVHPASSPQPASYGVSLDRLPSEDPATRHILRTAAAERALRQQQIENDELKRLVMTQRQEAGHLRQQLERLSGELAASSQTILRQTATLRSFTSEMERRDAYHLIKERRETAPEATQGAEKKEPATQTQERVEALLAEVAQLKAENESLQKRCAQSSQTRCGVRAVEAIERDEDEMDADELRGQEEGKRGALHRRSHNAWIPCAAQELQQLAEALGRMLTGEVPRTSVPSASPFVSHSASRTNNLVFEVVLRDLSFAAASAPQSCGVLSVCGPYKMDEVLLAIHLNRMPPLSPQRQHQNPHSCCFYALADTQAVLSLRCTGEGVAGEGCASGERQPDVATVAAASIPVRALIAAAAATSWSAQDMRSRQSSRSVSTVHTVHLHAAGEGTSCGAATFLACVTVLHPRTSESFVASGTRRRPVSVADSVHVSPLRPRQVHGSSTAPIAKEDATAIASRVSAAQRHAPLISPTREDVHDASTPRRLTPLSSPPSEKATPVFYIDESEAKPNTAARELRADVRTALSVEEDVNKESPSAVTPAEAIEPPVPVQSPRPPSPTVTGETVPLPPLVSVPAPPAATVPPPPSAVPPASAPATASPSATRLRIDVVALTEFQLGSSEDVEDLLERCAVQVDVFVGDHRVFATPSRRNLARTVWAASEATVLTTLKPLEGVRFEVREATAAATAVAAASPSAAVAQATLDAADVLGAEGERELTLTSVADGVPCGRLTVFFSPAPLRAGT